MITQETEMKKCNCIKETEANNIRKNLLTLLWETGYLKTWVSNKEGEICDCIINIAFAHFLDEQLGSGFLTSSIKLTPQVIKQYNITDEFIEQQKVVNGEKKRS